VPFLNASVRRGTARVARGSELRYEIARTAREWSALAVQWNELLEESRANCVFLTWEWQDTWRSLQERDGDLLTICIRGPRGELLGIAPFHKVDYTLAGAVPYRVLRMAGEVDCGGEYLTWIAPRSCEQQVSAEIVRALRALRSEWDLIWMPKLPSWSGAHQPMIEAMQAGGLTLNKRANSFTSIALPQDYASYLALMSANRRQQVRRMSHKILSRPGVEVRRVRSSAELGPALEALFRLHNERWSAAGGQGVFARNPKEKAFYERFAPKALAAGWLALYVLLDCGEPKAVQLGYVYDSTFVQLQEGFDPNYSPHAGNVLRARVIEDCIRSRLREYDFLAGVSEHKRRWLGRQRVGMDLLVGAPHWKTLPIMRLGLWPTGAYLRPRSPRLAGEAGADQG
jgi:CelD/BcsL family acetyltransferase involved in cellulose biosynthesis